MIASHTDGFATLACRDFRAGAIARRVFQVGEGPPVLLLHELPGLSPATLSFARETLVAAGFGVHLPVLFGEPGENQAVQNFARVCLSQLIHWWRNGCEGPLLDWLTALCRDLHTRHPGPGVGVIGMCLTGHFAIALMLEASVVAPVTCQPVVPLWPCARTDLGLSPAQWEGVQDRAAQAVRRPALIGLRYSRDPLCPAGRFQRLQAGLGEAFEACEIPGWGHSTLVEHFGPHPSPDRAQAAARVVAFLRERLAPGTQASEDSEPPLPGR